jgi:sulfopyruvate decarboxylase subunit alpha
MNVEASEAIVRGLKSAGVDLVAILPDHGFDRVQKSIAEDKSFTFVPVSNEGIGAGICAGAFFGGKSPALMIPTSGLLVASWPLASLHNLWNIPLLLLIPFRGDVGDAQPQSKMPSHLRSPGRIRYACCLQGRHCDEENRLS